MIKKCLICEKEFMPTNRQIKIGHGKFCSRKCKGKYQSENMKGRKFSEEHRRKLSEANKGKKRPPRSEEWKRKKSEAMKGKKTGEKHHNWKGGITPITKRIRDSEKYLQWRQSIFIRDNFTCQKCGIKGAYLQAHHKKPFHKFVMKIKSNLSLFNSYEGAMIYTPLWDVKNGITLCEKCHNKINKRR